MKLEACVEEIILISVSIHPLFIKKYLNCIQQLIDKMTIHEITL